MGPAPSTATRTCPASASKSSTPSPPDSPRPVSPVFVTTSEGCGRSQGDYRSAGHTDLVADARACLDALTRGDLGTFGPAYLLGHSEGTLIAAQLAAQAAASRPDIAGIVLLAPFIDRIESILTKQAAQLERDLAAARGIRGLVLRVTFRFLGPPSRSQRKLIDRIKTTQVATFRSRGQPVAARAIRELIQLDPPAIYRGVTCPVLAIGGAKDLQCDPGDVARIAATAPAPIEAHVIPDLSHVLRLDAGVPSMLETARLLDRPLAPEVLDLVTNWLIRRATPTLGETPAL